MAREFKAFTGKDIEQVFEEKKLPGLRLNYNDGTIVIEYEKVEEIFQVSLYISNVMRYTDKQSMSV